MRFFNSGSSSSYEFSSPTKENQIQLLSISENKKVYPVDYKNKMQKAEPSQKLSKENNKFLKALKSGSGFKRI